MVRSKQRARLLSEWRSPAILDTVALQWSSVPPSLPQVLLRTDGIGVPKPRTKVCIDLGRRRESKMMHMVARRYRVDPAEPRVRQPSGKHNVTVEPALPRRHLGKRHAHLKGDARLFGKYDHGPAGGNGTADGLIEHPHGGVLASEVMRQVVASAGMRLIAVGEAALAARAFPKRMMS